MTSLPSAPTAKKLGLVIDLDVCVGCHACVVACKEWNTGGYGAALSDQQPYGADVSGAWLNRVHTYEVTPEARDGVVIGEAGDAFLDEAKQDPFGAAAAGGRFVGPVGKGFERARRMVSHGDEAAAAEIDITSSVPSAWRISPLTEVNVRRSAAPQAGSSRRWSDR